MSLNSRRSVAQSRQYQNCRAGIHELSGTRILSYGKHSFVGRAMRLRALLKTQPVLVWPYFEKVTVHFWTTLRLILKSCCLPLSTRE
jgi:hypothetical protein